MLKIIEGPIVYRKRCTNRECEALLQFNVSDLIETDTGYGFTLVCPCCKERMSIWHSELEKLKTKEEEVQ